MCVCAHQQNVKRSFCRVCDLALKAWDIGMSTAHMGVIRELISDVYLNDVIIIIIIIVIIITSCSIFL